MFVSLVKNEKKNIIFDIVIRYLGKYIAIFVRFLSIKSVLEINIPWKSILRHCRVFIFLCVYLMRSNLISACISRVQIVIVLETIEIGAISTVSVFCSINNAYDIFHWSIKWVILLEILGGIYRVRCYS